MRNWTQAMSTGIPKSAAALILGALSIAVAGCGGATKSTHTQARAPQRPVAFAWLAPAAPPPTWRVLPISSGAAMPYPPGWKRVRGDVGTATAILSGAGQRVLGYLNLTPRQGAETPASWARFRVEHNAEEGDRRVKTLAVGTGLRFRSGHGSCVRDSYTTKTGAQYVEVACLVVGSKGASVIIGASPPDELVRISPLIERAISGFTT
jgi:hypothetical protein